VNYVVDFSAADNILVIPHTMVPVTSSSDTQQFSLFLTMWAWWRATHTNTHTHIFQNSLCQPGEWLLRHIFRPSFDCSLL